MVQMDNNEHGARSSLKGLKSAAGAWVALTTREQRAVLLVVVLVILGVAVKYWHGTTRDRAGSDTPVEVSEAQ